MVESDLEYISRLIAARVLDGPVLELGTGYGGSTCKDIFEAAGFKYFGTDLTAGLNVDFVANFEDTKDMVQFQINQLFGTIVILNVLEHSFDPIKILDNAKSLIKPGGSIVVITPAVWPLHSFPMDVWRILPNFYEEYSMRRNVQLASEYFEYIGFGLVYKYKNSDGTYRFPPPCQPGLRWYISRAIHKLFNTFGRAMFQPSHVAVGAVFLNIN